MGRPIFLIALFTLLYGCEDVIEVEVPVDRPRLVMDALIRLEDISEPTINFKVKATTTSSFFEVIEPAKLDEIILTNIDSHSIEVLTEVSEGSGIYQKEVPMEMLVHGELELTMTYNGQEYRARTKFVPSVPVDRLEQGTGTLFSGDETEVILTFTDAPDRTDFYLFHFDFNEYLVSEDTYYPGQPVQFSYFYDESLNPGREIKVSILGVDKPFYNYMNQLILQGSGQQGPFQTPATTIKGNIINTTDQDNFALGYFAVCQSFSAFLIIQK